MKTYRIYGEFIQRVYVDVVAIDAEHAGDEACDLPLNNWHHVDHDADIDQTEITLL